MEDLSHRDPGLQRDPAQNFIKPLAEEEGALAAAAAVKKLQEMELSPET